MEEFGRRLKLLRKEKDLQQVQLGEIFGLSPSAIGSYERGLREPTYNQLVQFAEYFGVSLDYMLGRAEERLTVKSYIDSGSYELLSLISRVNLSVNGHKLSSEDKQRLSDVAIGLFWTKYSDR